MESMKVFKSGDFGSIRAIEQNGKVLFCGKDIAAALGYPQTAHFLLPVCFQQRTLRFW